MLMLVANLTAERTNELERAAYFSPNLGMLAGASEEEFCDSPSSEIQTRPSGWLRRIFDISLSSIFLLLALPLMLVVSAAIFLTSRGPVIISQRRLTRGGREFLMYKFRSMVADAEEQSGAVWAAYADPRVTKVGKFLRVSRLDELPQLVNVLLGDMTLIGPRPERPEIAAQLEKVLPEVHRRLEIKAGLTGLAQVSVGYTSCVSSYSKKLERDLYYIQNRSALLDLWIAFRTVFVVLTGQGAR